MDPRRAGTEETLTWVSNPDGARTALAFLDAAQRQLADLEGGIDAPLVDETEHERLERAAGGTPDVGWWGFVAVVGSTTGYAGVRAPGDDLHGHTAHVAEVAVHPHVPGALARTVEIATEFARRGGAAGLDVWVRRVDSGRTAELERVGYRPGRLLAVLGRDLDEPPSRSTGAGEDVVIRPAREGVDDQHVVDVLDAAFRDTEDGGWTRERFTSRKQTTWFRHEDVLLAESGGTVLGVHWLKRRTAEVGEVYNLAVHPAAHGRGVGALLLRAGLEHLRALGMRRVVLWVDRSNDVAVRVYERAGFETLWDDVRFEPSGNP